MSSFVVQVAAFAASAALGGIAGGLLVWSMSRPDAPSVKQEPSKAARTEQTDESDDTVAFEARVRELETAVRAIERRARSTEALKQYAKSLADPEDGDSPKRPAMPGVVDAEDPTFELAVRTVMDRLDWEKQEEQRVTQAQRSNERAQRQTTLLAERLGLRDDQREQVSVMLGKQMEAFRALRNPDSPNVLPPATRSEWRERLQEIRERTESELAKVLDPTQLEGYKAFIEEEWVGGRGDSLRGGGIRSERQERSGDRRSSGEGRGSGERRSGESRRSNENAE